MDSTLHIQWWRGTARAVSWLRENAEEELLTSAISVGETYSGVKPVDEGLWRRYFAEFRIIAVDGPTAEFAGSLRYRLARKGRQIELPDTLIAAQALLNGWPVVTANVKDFARPGPGH